MTRLGFHFPFSGGLVKLQERVSSSRGNSYQIFARGLRGGNLHKLNAKNLADFLAFTERKKIKPAIVHAPYVYNIANLDAMDEQKVLEDLEYCKSFMAPYYVLHPGYYKNIHPIDAIDNVKFQLWDIFQKTDWLGEILIKNQRGAGTELCADFREWKELITTNSQVKGALDLSRAYIAGYDFTNKESAKKFYETIRDHIGWDNIRVIYINDSNFKIGSRREDRNPPVLGEGVIGFKGYKHILSYPEVQSKVWISENNPTKGNMFNNINFLQSFHF